MKHRTAYTTLLAFIGNLLIAYLCFAVCRLVFVWENWDIVGRGLLENPWTDLLCGALRFDTSAIVVTHLPYLLLMLLPFHGKESLAWQRTARWVFIVIGTLCICLNMADVAYFPFSGRRTTITVLDEFSAEGNIGTILLAELCRHWYLFLTAALLIAAMARFSLQPRGEYKPRSLRRYYLLHTLALLLFVPLAVGGQRGGFSRSTRPITMSDANRYVRHPSEAAVILNTPFCIFRSIGKQVFVNPGYFTEEVLDSLYSPVHRPEPADTIRHRRNVVVLIVESFGREFVGALNEDLDDGKYRGYTPFLDSLVHASMTFEYSFANGRKSIDAMPSILSSIPMFVEPFVLTPAAMNDVGGLAHELGRDGYSSAFFHGADNGSMGFQAFARSTGFQHYYGRTEYEADPRFGGENDFDGTWAIWDEPFLQFYALKMSELKEPFVTAVFTASSYHPFAIPDSYKGRFAEESDPNPIHKCIRYTDEALRRFFETARRQPWFENTLFVLTADHTNQPDHMEFLTDLGVFASPILFYDPSGQTFPPARRAGIAQQIDIMPTVLSALGCKGTYIAFGKDLKTTPPAETWAVDYFNGIYQYVQGDYILQYDGSAIKGLYNYRKDWYMQYNLSGTGLPQESLMLHRLQAIIQSYMQRMEGNSLMFREDTARHAVSTTDR